MTETAVSAYYDAYWRRGEFTTRPPRRLLELFERYVAEDHRCLDVGCGDGGTSGPWLSSRAASYLGVDVAESAVRAATARGLRAQRVDDAAELPFDSRSFEIVTCIEVLEHLFSPQAVVREIRRVLSRRGLLIVTVPNVAHWRTRADLALLGRWNGRGDRLSPSEPWRDPHIRFFTVRSLAKLLIHEGYTVLEAGGFTEEAVTQFLPGLRRLGRSPYAGPVGRTLARLSPSVFAGNAYAVATPANDASTAPNGTDASGHATGA